MLGLLPMAVRVWSRMLSAIVEQWCQSLEDHWDTALKGSSALRASLRRATLDESARAMSVAHASLYMDL